MNLVLIPKVAHPELITQFRPISLCNTLYKLLSSIIVHRLKPYMVKAIKPCQAGFVPGHRTSDNIIIVHEVIKTLISQRVGRGMLHSNWILKKLIISLSGILFRKLLNFFSCLQPSLPSS